MNDSMSKNKELYNNRIHKNVFSNDILTCSNDYIVNKNVMTIALPAPRDFFQNDAIW